MPAYLVTFFFCSKELLGPQLKKKKFQGIFEHQPIYLSGSTPVTLIQAPKLARPPSVSPVPATCHLQYAVPSLRNSGHVYISLTVLDSTGRFSCTAFSTACFVKETVADTLGCVWGNGSTRDETTWLSGLSGKAVAELRPEPRGSESPWLSMGQKGAIVTAFNFFNISRVHKNAYFDGSYLQCQDLYLKYLLQHFHLELKETFLCFVRTSSARPLSRYLSDIQQILF